MNRIKKHQFEAVSLLTVDNGLLDITVIPAKGQPDWIVPSNLILSIDDYEEHIWTYLWNSQEVAVYHLIPRSVTPDKIVVLEGNTDVHRVGLQTRGELRHMQVNIAEAQDSTLNTQSEDSVENRNDAHDDIPKDSENAPVTYAGAYQGGESDYIYQTVTIGNDTYVVPDLDELAHRLVDLDS